MKTRARRHARQQPAARETIFEFGFDRMRLKVSALSHRPEAFAEWSFRLYRKSKCLGELSLEDLEALLRVQHGAFDLLTYYQHGFTTEEFGEDNEFPYTPKGLARRLNARPTVEDSDLA